jgi:hypothetical protein
MSANTTLVPLAMGRGLSTKILLILGGAIPLDEHPQCHHRRGGHCGCCTSAALNHYDGCVATRCWPRGHARGCASVPPQPSRPARFTIDSRAVASRRRPAHRRCYQHTASRRVVGKPPRWGASAINGTLMLTDSATHAVGTTRTSGKSRYNGFTGRTRASPLR